jgi:hypothetical protein
MNADRSESDAAKTGGETGSVEADPAVAKTADRSGAGELEADIPEEFTDAVPEGTAVEDRLARLFRDGRTNAFVAWSMIAVLVGVFVESLFDLDLQSVALAAAIGAVVLAPTAAARNPLVMLPWEVLGVALLPVLVGALLGGEVGVFATYLSIAALALIITVELHMFTSLRVTHWFAVVFVVMTTMATAGVWAILRWNMDRMLGTSYLTTNEALMIEWIYVTLAGLAAGVLFDAYFRRRGLRLRRAIWRVVSR